MKSLNIDGKYDGDTFTFPPYYSRGTHKKRYHYLARTIGYFYRSKKRMVRIVPPKV